MRACVKRSRSIQRRSDKATKMTGFKKQNILYIHNKAQISGGERSLLNLWAGLDKARFTPYLMVPEKGPLTAAAETSGVEVICHAVPSLRPWNMTRVVKSFQFLTAYVRCNRIALIHSYAPRNNILAALVGKLCRIPVIWHERNLLYAHEFDISKKLLFLPDRVICNSHAVADRFKSCGKISKKIVMIHNGVNTNIFTPAVHNVILQKSMTKIVGAVLNLDQKKGAHLIPDLAVKISVRIPDVHFFVIGGGLGEDTNTRLNTLRDMASQRGMASRITFTGFTNDVPNHLRSFDVFIHPTSNEYKEACSRAILEAQSCGIPVVAFRNGGNSELVEDGITGILVPPGDFGAFAEAVIKLLLNSELCQEMGRNARARVEKYFDVRRNTETTEALYQELLEHAPRN